MQVLVIPQSRMPGAFSPEMAEAVRRFLKAGGGLIALHDAVGLRGLPALAPEVCAGGAAHARDYGWVVKADHPLGAGLTGEQALAQSCYDHVVLTPGPRGTAIAVGATDGAPMLICGGIGKGRYVAWGLAIGISKNEDSDIPPTTNERLVPANAVNWCANGK